jgi:hypothetical protein
MISRTRSRMCHWVKTSQRVKAEAHTKNASGMVDFFLATSKPRFDWVSSEAGAATLALERLNFLLLSLFQNQIPHCPAPFAKASGAGLVHAQIKAAHHPSTVHPKSKLVTAIAPRLRCLRPNATKVGIQYRGIKTSAAATIRIVVGDIPASLLGSSSAGEVAGEGEGNAFGLALR